MAFVDRPNKDALSKAIDIFLDEMRPYLIRCLSNLPGTCASDAIVGTLGNERAERFAENSRSGDLHSALEVSYFLPLVSNYWEDVFAFHFRNDVKILSLLKSVTYARNNVSHPPHLRDLDRSETLEHLGQIVDLLGGLRAREAIKAVSRIRADLEKPGAVAQGEESKFKKMEEQYRKAVSAKGEVEEFLCASKSALEETVAKLREESSACRSAEEKVQELQATISRTDEETQRQMEVRRKAEEQAMAEAVARQKAELAAQASEAALKEEEGRTRSTSAELKIAEERIRELEKEIQERSTSVQRVLSDTPFDRRSAEYELWLVDEILSERTSRDLLRQYAGDSRLEGRLVYFVNAAASDMTATQWQGYVSNRQKALLRNGKNRTNPLDRQRSHGHLGLSH